MSLPRALLFLSLASCASTWKAGPELYAPADHVAAALGERRAPVPHKPESLLAVRPPIAVRPCCAFGVDLSFAAVPLYKLGNVLDPASLGRHFYGASALEAERNGLVYTCRGGWIDTAHARENADLTFFLISQLLSQLPGPATIELAGEGGTRTVTVKPLPPELFDRWGPERLAEAIASWVVWQFAIWHELSSWFGYEALPGYPERVSTFSPEDMYSNALGIRLGAAVAREGGLLSRTNYDALTEAWLSGMLSVLGAVDEPSARDAMKHLDGHWWDSTRKLPDLHLVQRRNLATGTTVEPWRLQDAFAPGLVALPPACSTRAPALELQVPDRLGEFVVPTYVDVRWKPGPWALTRVPWSDPEVHEVHATDLPRLTRQVHDELEAALGPGFEKPR